MVVSHSDYYRVKKNSVGVASILQVGQVSLEKVCSLSFVHMCLCVRACACM